MTGWFSFFHGEATAGDLLAARVDPRNLADQLRWSLGAEAARTARSCALRARGALADVRSELVARFTEAGAPTEESMCHQTSA
ncbi:hypothetical protein ACFQWH_15460 [Mycolicibacterium sp. GCM10028919]|uniref:hypothetical protein n=1 Tax=Mycolicibacterium sp. GCM10028919 TaxID=3273401 RepID=UPI00361CC7EE